jgi:GMP synthase (glutamine-hydrolysing)
VAGGQRSRTWPGRTGRVLFVQHQDDCPPGHVGARMAERGAQLEVVSAEQSRFVEPARFDLIVSLGSYDSAHDDSVSYVSPESELFAAAVDAGVGVFGICFGAQLLSRVLGGQVFPAPGGPEIGWLTVDTPARGDGNSAGNGSAGGLVAPGPWLVWHMDVMTCPPGGTELARTGVGTQAFVHGPHVGVQFHPEATPEAIGVWARHYRAAFRDAGIDPALFLMQTRELAAASRRRGRALTDRVVDRIPAF